VGGKYQKLAAILSIHEGCTLFQLIPHKRNRDTRGKAESNAFEKHKHLLHTSTMFFFPFPIPLGHMIIWLKCPPNPA
jgi:hypothetical protein